MSVPGSSPGSAPEPGPAPGAGPDGPPVLSPDAGRADGDGRDDRVVLDAEDISRALTRMAHQILEANRGAEGLVLAGIPSRGVPLAHRLAAAIAAAEPGLGPDGAGVPTGALDVTLYRDDLRSQPTRAVGHTRLPVPVDGAVVVLVDDVLFSGRTVRAALDALGDLGRPRAVRLAVLVDRGHRQLPIRADHVGKNLPTAADERVLVRLAETDGVTEVRIVRPPANPSAGTRPGVPTDPSTRREV